MWCFTKRTRRNPQDGAGSNHSHHVMGKKRREENWYKKSLIGTLLLLLRLLMIFLISRHTSFFFWLPHSNPTDCGVNFPRISACSVHYDHDAFGSIFTRSAVLVVCVCLCACVNVSMAQHFSSDRRLGLRRFFCLIYFWRFSFFFRSFSFWVDVTSVRTNAQSTHLGHQ